MRGLPAAAPRPRRERPFGPLARLRPAILAAVALALLLSLAGLAAIVSKFGATAILPSPQSLIAWDLDGDGRPDLAGAGDEGYACLLLGQGGGAFAPPVQLPAGSKPSCIEAADRDGDGKPDLALSNWGGGDVWVLKNDGQGRFSLAAKIPLAGRPWWSFR